MGLEPSKGVRAVLDEISLVGMTGNVELDMALYGVVGLGHIAFPGRVLGCYLVGSHANGEAVQASDVDVVVVFKGSLQPGEAERFMAFQRFCWLLGKVEVDVSLVAEAWLRERGAVHLKLSSLLLQGEDVREQLPLMSLELWLRECMHKPYQFIERSRPLAEDEPLRYPLRPPDPSGEFYGYDYRQLKGPEGALHPSTKEVMTLTSRVATARLALEAGVYAHSKRMAVQAYREHIGGEWAPLLEELFAYRERWGYMLPSEPAARARFRELCSRVVELENFFLPRYRDFMLAELERGALEERVLAAERLGQVIYEDNAATEAALERCASTGPEPLRQAAERSLARLRRFSAHARAS
jgi:predicted nucleotidyltransferase